MSTKYYHLFLFVILYLSFVSITSPKEVTTSEEIDSIELKSLLPHRKKFLHPRFHSIAEIPTTKVNIYTPGNKCVIIPESSEYPTSYQIPHQQGQIYRYESGDTVKTDNKGLVTPYSSVTYWYGGAGYISKFPDQEPDDTDIEYRSGITIIKVELNSELIAKYEINVIDYGKGVVDKVFDDYIQANVIGLSTTLEKLTAITKWTANIGLNKDYDFIYNTPSTMLHCGIGSETAGANAICTMCGKIGFNQCHVRFGGNEPGAEKKHRTAAVLVDNTIYSCNVGVLSPDWQGDTLRSYKIDVENVGWYYSKSSTNELTVLQYDGFEKDLVLPSTIDGFTVTAVGENCFYYGQVLSGNYLESVKLPDSIKKIGGNAFLNIEKIKEILIPKGVETIGSKAFVNMTDLTKFEVDKDNKNFAAENGALFNKDKTILYYYPIKKPDIKYTVPEGVATITDYAFYLSNGTQSVYLPSTLQEIKTYGFGNSKSITNIYFTSENVPKIASNAFSNIKELNIYYPKGNENWKKEEGKYGSTNIKYNEWDPNEKPKQDEEKKPDEEGGSNNTTLIIILVIAAVIILGAIAFIALRKCFTTKVSSAAIEQAGPVY